MHRAEKLAGLISEHALLLLSYVHEVNQVTTFFFSFRLSVVLMWIYCEYITVTGHSSVKVPFI